MFVVIAPVWNNLYLFGQEQPDTKIQTIIETVVKDHNFTISYKKAWFARTKAIEMLFGDWGESYKQLPKYMLALQVYNPGTVVVWDYIPPVSQSIVMLNFVFWAFKPSIDGFKHCRPVICIDGTHLYGKYIGKMLIATGITAQNKVFPIAFAIVDEESSKSWKWFLRNVIQHVVPGRFGLTLISDRAKGILSAVKDVWTDPSDGQPIGYHRYCLRHVCSNFNSRFHNIHLKDLVWRAGTRTQVRKLNAILQKIESINPDALKWLHEIDPVKWTLAHDGGKRWGVMTTNHAEAFNGVVKGARNVPITACVELTFYRLVKYFDTQGSEALHWKASNNYMFPKFVEAILDKNMQRANAHNLVPFDR